MRAWRFIGGGQPLECQQLPDPVAGHGEVVVRVRMAGLCHSDLHIVHGQFPYKAPLTLGHEGAGVIASVGSGVQDLTVGDRVAVYGGAPCGRCKLCLAGRTNICPDRGHAGLDNDGSFADFVSCPAVAVVPLPDGVSFAAGAVATDAVLTPFHALNAVGRLQRGERIGIFGIGGLGHNAVQIARHLGAEVIAIDPSESKRALALAAGADAAHPDASSLMGSLDIAADFVGVESSILSAVMAIAAGGRVVLAGLGALQANVFTARFGIHEIAILGTFWGTRDELIECLDLIDDGVIDPLYEIHPLDTVNEQIDRLTRGEVNGRVVLEV